MRTGIAEVTTHMPQTSAVMVRYIIILPCFFFIWTCFRHTRATTSVTLVDPIRIIDVEPEYELYHFEIYSSRYNLAVTQETSAITVLQKDQIGESRTSADVQRASDDLSSASKLFKWLRCVMMMMMTTSCSFNTHF